LQAVVEVDMAAVKVVQVEMQAIRMDFQTLVVFVEELLAWVVIKLLVVFQAVTVQVLEYLVTVAMAVQVKVELAVEVVIMVVVQVIVQVEVVDQVL